jgi:hypothetical protein
MVNFNCKFLDERKDYLISLLQIQIYYFLIFIYLMGEEKRLNS